MITTVSVIRTFMIMITTVSVIMIMITTVSVIRTFMIMITTVSVRRTLCHWVYMRYDCFVDLIIVHNRHTSDQLSLKSLFMNNNGFITSFVMNN